MHKRSSLLLAIPLLLATAALSAPAAWADNNSSTAQDRVNDAVKIVHQMKQNPQLAELLSRSRGIFVVPHYGRGAFIVGGQGGGGVVLLKRDGEWTDPAFFSIAGGSVGLQAGGSGGSVAMILMTPKAAQRFESGGTWSLNGNAGLTVATWSGRSQGNVGKGDVIIWSNTKGLYGGLTASLTKISPDQQLDQDFYQRQVSSHEILTGQVTNAEANPLRSELATRVATR